MNALHGPEGCRWFDWSEASVAHPFMDVGWCLAWLMHPSRAALGVRRDHPEAASWLWRGYLQALEVPGAEPLIPEAVTLAMTHHALVYHDQYASWQGTVPGRRPQYVPYYLRLLLKVAAMLTG